ncbi:DUF317 domain-containing protein [Streptomyces sp. ISL-12]|uniref:DUF317 domain-containing protein n=1 Tax=Streptomyces sp. ISL-12 TaxID=2819177 RepID=UPI001BEAF86E|nr:DUF317 domain-containing protein [Streptomyces sp. ISL-12]MBT2409340.1 DUF317 domain-containing protein [Streptomyces sp. ISL-12]
MVSVSPVYLAGGGDPAWVTVPLHRACGWSHGNDPLQPRVLLSSPDQKALLRLEPRADGPWWTIQHARTADHPAWSARFDARTPVEVIAAFTDALTSPSQPAVTPDPFEPLREARWPKPEIDRRRLSPDGLVRINDHPNWEIRTALPMEPIWRADLDRTTPPHLVTILTTALASRTPLLRRPDQVPHLARDRMALTARDIPAEALASALEDRVRALAAHRAAHTAPARPRPSTGHGRTR